MKPSTQIAAALLALGIVSRAYADPTVYLTGSTAFRSTVYASLVNNTGPANGGVFDSGSVTYATWGSSSASGSNYMVFHGNIGGSGVYVDCAWSGSEAGIASACNATLGNTDRNGNPITLNGSPETWVNATNATLSAAGVITTANPTSGQLEANSHGSDLAQADTSQAISWTPFVANTQTALKDYGVQGIVTFTITRNVQTVASNEWTHCSNITLPQLNTLFANGATPAGFISGNTNDNDFVVYLVGRNLGSGTRMNMLGDSAYGAHKAVQQYSIGYGIEAGEAQVNSCILTNEGNGGYESGGGVAKALGNTGSCQQADPFNGGVGWFAVGYLGPADALNTANYGGEPTNNWMTVDGVFSSNGSIENGQWWYWGHEHLLGKYQISGTADTVGTKLFAGVTKTLQTLNLGADPNAHDAAIQNSLMHVFKDSDVGFPHPSGSIEDQFQHSLITRPARICLRAGFWFVAFADVSALNSEAKSAMGLAGQSAARAGMSDNCSFSAWENGRLRDA